MKKDVEVVIHQTVLTVPVERVGAYVPSPTRPSVSIVSGLYDIMYTPEIEWQNANIAPHSKDSQPYGVAGAPKDQRQAFEIDGTWVHCVLPNSLPRRCATTIEFDGHIWTVRFERDSIQQSSSIISQAIADLAAFRGTHA